MSEPVFFFLIVGRSLKPFPQSDQEGTSDVVYRPHSPFGGYEDPHGQGVFSRNLCALGYPQEVKGFFGFLFWLLDFPSLF
jgi:hypothetical protein